MSNYLILLITLICYTLFFLLGFLVIGKTKPSTTGPFSDSKQISSLNIRHIQGIILLGLPLLIFLNYWADQLKWPKHLSNSQAAIFALLFFTVVTIAFKSAYTKQLVPNEFLINKKHVNTTPLYIYFVLRILFLIVYEFFFRGILLIVCNSCFGIEWAIAINILLYAGIHILNDKEQVLASIPFGFALCMFCITWQSLWPAIILHLTLSVTHESYTLYSTHYFTKKIEL